MAKSEYEHKSHNVTMLLYHYVCPAKYRQTVFEDQEVERVLRETCEGIEKRYEIRFLEIGSDMDHVHFLVQSVPMLSPTQIIRTIKSITAKQIFKECPQVKEKLWGGSFWTSGYFVNTVGLHGNEEIIARYVREQGKEQEYRKFQGQQASFFE